jgi:hypothetical protein
MSTALSGLASTNEQLEKHKGATAEALSALEQRVESSKNEMEKRLQSEVQALKRNSEESLSKLQGQLMSVIRSSNDANSESEKQLHTATSALVKQLSDQNEKHDQDFRALSEKIETTNAALSAAQEANAVALAAARDDTMRNLERAGEVLTEAMQKSTASSIGQLAGKHAEELAAITDEVQAAKTSAQRGLKSLEELGQQVKLHKEDADRLSASFRDAEEQRGSWQNRMDAANSSFRAQLDGYLQNVGCRRCVLACSPPPFFCSFLTLSSAPCVRLRSC